MKRQSRGARDRLAAELSALAEARKFKPRPSLERRERTRAAKPGKLIAYDLETSRIAVGTPRPLYLTAYGADFQIETPIRTMTQLRQILVQQFLTKENKGARFVAWNGNRFDAFFIAAALLPEKDLILRPYMTRSKVLRGLRVSLAKDGDARNAMHWEFLDGIAMTGLVGTTLEKFVGNFAPDFPKLTGTIDFEREEFDSTNPTHCAYAMRDSEGLYHAITRAQRILLDTFGEPLGVTMGGACIKIFQAHIPRDVVVDALPHDLNRIVADYVMRGGFCYLMRRYDGPVWKYDINQAYAHAMRAAKLPAGAPLRGKGNPRARSGVYVVKCRGWNPSNTVPFYYRAIVGGRIRSLFGIDEIQPTWLTSIEFEQLRAEGWRLECDEFYSFSHSFDMTEYVTKLETLRAKAPGGPSGPEGTMIKATGNHSYGKTVEQIEPIEFLLSEECPDGYQSFYGDSFEPIDHIYCRIDSDRRAKAYHQPHLGAFITAFVRMQVRRAALLAPTSFLYADTDCVIFDSDVTARLDIDPKRYGAWKVEESGKPYLLIAKKVYTDKDGSKKSAKGLHVRKLTGDDFAQWYEGRPPVQDQVQVQNFLSVIQGAEMFRAQRRQGTRVEAQESLETV